MKKIVLVGNPNVGKSVVFSQLTGSKVMISNYSGTTVEFTGGQLTIGEDSYAVMDAPGTYSLTPSSKVEEVAADMVDQADVVINVVDATNLERNLLLTSEVLERDVPVIIALNMIDEAGHKGVKIDVEKLEELLGVPVIPTVAVSGEGLKKLVDALPKAINRKKKPLEVADRWAYVGSVVGEVQTIIHRHHTWLESLQDDSLRPLTGIPIVAIVLYLAFQLVIGVGEVIAAFLEEYFFGGFYGLLMNRLSEWLGSGGFLHDILIGRLFDGAIQFEESLGVLTTGVFVEFGIVLPFLTVFYLVLGFLEDSGYLPRLAVMADRVMHRVGLHGYSIIPMVLGFGCNVPAVLAARNLESRRERFIVCTLTSVAVPCMAQLAMIVGLVGRFGGAYLAVVFASLFFIWIVLGLIIDRFMPGYTPSMVVEIPPYRIPSLRAQFKKLGMRVKGLIVHATPYILGGILLVNILYTSGIVDYLGIIFKPVIQGVLGLPGEAVSTLLIGFLRKDVAVAMLVPLGLNARQFVIGAVVLAAYFPCAATFAVLLRELGLRDMFKSAIIMVLTSFSAGFMLNMLLDTVVPAPYMAAGLVVAAIILAFVVGSTSDRRELEDLDKAV
ncbi:MAG: ferrous iron transporter B [Bacillota bacterium]|nr:ferrous iron transporter B [Bacillota bacterium]